MRINKKIIGIGLILAALLFSQAASTASNTVAAGAGRLGYSDTTVTGGTINSIDYTLDSAHPPLITAVKINVTDMTPDAVVKVRGFGPARLQAESMRPSAETANEAASSARVGPGPMRVTRRPAIDGRFRCG